MHGKQLLVAAGARRAGPLTRSVPLLIKNNTDSK